MPTPKNHPFAVETEFKTSLVLSYALPKEDLQDLLPPCLTVDTFDDKYGFVAIALVNTKYLRPKGFPKFMGNNFVLAGFRIFVRYKNTKGKSLRGLYILKSETNKKKMAIMGNFFTHYNYTTTDIEFQYLQNRIAVTSKNSKINIKVSTEKVEIPLPKGSPFKDWKEARRFAGPLPFTFTYNKDKKEVLIIQGVRSNWKPTPVEVLKSDIGFLERIEFKNAQLANAFVVENIPYKWGKGKLEKWSN